MRHRAHYIAILVLYAISCVAQADPDPTSWFRDITIPPGQTLNGATCFFCSIHVEGELKQDATTQWGDIDVHGVVGGDAVAVAGSIHLFPGARVQGDSVSVFGDNRLDESSQVAGDAVASWGSIQRSPTALAARSESANGPAFLSNIPPRWRTALILWLIGLCISVPLAFLCYWILGRARLERMAEQVQARRSKTLLFGALILAALTTAMALASASRPESLEPVLSGLLLLLLAPGYAALSLLIGQRYAAVPAKALLIGVVAIITVQIIPILGWIMALVMMVVSLGILAMAVAGRWKTTA